MVNDYLEWSFIVFWLTGPAYQLQVTLQYKCHVFMYSRKIIYM